MRPLHGLDTAERLCSPTLAGAAAATARPNGDGALPAGPATMPEVAHSLLSQFVTYAQFTVVERTLARVTGKDPDVQLVHRLQAQGELGGWHAGWAGASGGFQSRTAACLPRQEVSAFLASACHSM